MTTKELLQEKIDQLDEQQLGELYEVAKDLAKAPSKPNSAESFMSKLRKIRINAPPDFATNLDAYTSGEKSVE